MLHKPFFLQSLLYTSALYALGTCCPLPVAQAAPQNGQVLGGTAQISSSGETTTIQQSSDRALIRWDSFDVEAHEHINFVQPSAQSITVNRIMDNKASNINGRLSANGNVILVNPNGVVFGASSRVDVGGLVATSSDLEDDNVFMNGGPVRFTKSGKADAKIINHGTLKVRDAGLVGLVAPHVENNGLIQARLGTVHLAAGDLHTIDLAGDGLIKLEVSPETLSLSAKNTGTIQADGGEILVSAAQARHLVEALVTNTGHLQAHTVKEADHTVHEGRVTLSTRDSRRPAETGHGHVLNTGVIQANGEAEGLNGGHVTLLSDEITLENGTQIEAHGMKNGGHIQVGGAYQGGDTLPPAHHVHIAEQAIVNADSKKQGQGGSIIFWSQDSTRFYGQASARGGAEGGDGGLIEISGKKYLDFDGTVDLRSLNGQNGTLLLDPTNITISSAADLNNTGASPFSPTADDVSSVINVTTLQNALAAGNVIVQTRATGSQAGDITVSNAITWASGNLLTLDAHNNIVVSSGATITGANLTLIAGNDVQLSANLTGTGTVTLKPGADNISVGLGNSATGTFTLTTTEISKLVNGWSSIVIGRDSATAATDIQTTSWNDALTVQSGTGAIGVNGIITMNAGNNLTLKGDGDLALNLANALTGTGDLTISQSSVNTTLGLGNAQAGTLNLDTTEIGRIKDGWSSITIGRTDGGGVMNVDALTWTDALSLQTGNGTMNINGTQTMAGNALTLKSDGDIALTGNLTGTGTLTIQSATTAGTIALGDAQTGALNLDATELGRITDGWTNLVFGRTDGTGTINIGAMTWNDLVTFQSGTGVIAVNGTQNMGLNNLTITTDGNPFINAALVGTDTFTLNQASVGTSMAIGTGETGTVLFDSTEIGMITNGWTDLIFGRTDGTGTMNVGATSWLDRLTLQSGTGQISINGDLNTTSSLTFSTDADLALNADLITSASNTTLTIQPESSATIGIGTGQTGTLSLTDTKLSHITSSWNSVIFGATSGTGTMNVGAHTWNNDTTLRTSSGALNINGNQNTGANNLTINTNTDLSLGVNLIGTGTLTFAGATNSTTIGVGTGQAGTLSINDTDLGFITDGWNSVVFGNTNTTGTMNIGAHTWNDSVTFRTNSGTLNINGAQNVGSNNLSILTSTNLALGINLIGTGTLTISGNTNATTVGIGTGQTGTLSLTDAELAFINDGWSNLVFGTTSATGALNAGAYTWLDNVEFRTAAGAMNINGAQNTGTNNLTLKTNSNLAIGAALTGTGLLSILGASTGTNLAIGTGETGTLALTNTELDFLTNGWSAITFGATNATGTMNVGARTWNDSVVFRTGNGLITVNGAQNTGANDLSFKTNSAFTINAALTGTGILTIEQSGAVSIGVGTGQTGTLALSDAELGLMTDGWSNIVIGSSTTGNALNVAARTWNDPLTLRTGSGVLTINGIQTMGANNLTIQTDSALTINAALTGTGILTIAPSAAATTFAVGTGQTGTLALSDTELSRFTDGWSSIVLGRTDGAGVMNVAAHTWSDPLTLQTGAGVLNVNGIQTMGANNLTFKTDSDINIGANLTGTGTLILTTSAPATSIGVGDSQTGTFALSNTELGRLVDGWSLVQIGDTGIAGNIAIGTNTWVNPMHFITAGNVTLNGVQTSTETSGTSLVFASTSGAFINNAGASAIDPGGGRSLVYSVNETLDTLGGLARPTILTNTPYNTYQPASVVEAGNVYLYAGTKILNLQIDNKNKAYGDSTPALTYTYLSGLQNGNTLGDAITGYTLTAAGSSVLDNVGTTHTITGSFSTALGYTVNLITGTLSVVKATLTITGDSDTREYGDTNPALNLTYAGFRNGEDSTVIDTLASASTAATLTSAVGSYAITGAGALDDNYAFTYVDGALSVTKATLTATADNKSREYGLANPAFTTSYTGFKNGETSAVIDTLASASTAATLTSAVGSYAITGAGALDDNYAFTYVDGALTITAASSSPSPPATTINSGILATLPTSQINAILQTTQQPIERMEEHPFVTQSFSVSELEQNAPLQGGTIIVIDDSDLDKGKDSEEETSRNKKPFLIAITSQLKERFGNFLK